MRVAFYAPLKPPDSPVPSGDRRIARLLIKALELGGHEVELLSRFRAFEGGGDAVRMGRLGVIGRKLAARCIRRIEAMPAERRPQAVFTYHVYDKAPDWIGPMVAQALGIPYLISEASLNPARAEGAMAIGHKAAKAAVAAADIILELKSSDRKGVEPALKPGAAIWDLPPFIDVAALEPRPGGEGRAGDTTATFKQALARAHGLERARPWLLTVAMMRAGYKLESYRVLAKALAALGERPWQLLVAGDGTARASVEDAFRSLGPQRVRFLGLQHGESLSQLYWASDIFVWPAVNEPLGMAILEAQAAAKPVIAGNHGAVGEIVSDGVTGILVPEGDPVRFAEALESLLDDPDRARAMGLAAREKAHTNHGIAGAARILDRALAAGVEDRSDQRQGNDGMDGTRNVAGPGSHRTRKREIT